MTSTPQKKLALITGASSGIGRALALEFAAGGFDLLLTAREHGPLEDVAKECRDKFGTGVEIFSADLSDPAATDSLGNFIAGKNIDVLVNNAGFAVKGDFAETALDKEMAMLNLQLAAMLKLTKAALPEMIAQKSGRILNVASVYSFSAVPKQAVYSACKSFIFAFSSALRAEVKKEGVTVTVLCPGITQTEFRSRAGIAGKKDSGMTAEAVAGQAYKAAMSGAFLVVPGFSNKLFVFLSRHLPFGLQMAMINFINGRRGINKH